jgi:hypothetical protein
MMFPLLISASGILTCVLVTLIATDLKPAQQISEIESTLKMQLVISTVLMTPVRGRGGGGGAVVYAWHLGGGWGVWENSGLERRRRRRGGAPPASHSCPGPAPAAAPRRLRSRSR